MVVTKVVERAVETETGDVGKACEVVIVDVDVDVDDNSVGCRDVSEESEHSVVAVVDVTIVSVERKHFSSSQCVVVKVVVDLTTYVDPDAVLVKREEAKESKVVSEVVDTSGISEEKVVHLLSSQCVVVNVVIENVVPSGVPTVELITIEGEDVWTEVTFVEETAVESEVVEIGVIVV